MGWLTGDCEAEDEVCEASARTVREETDREIINQPPESRISLPAIAQWLPRNFKNRRAQKEVFRGLVFSPR